jgi:hypothetical protein
MVETNKWFQPCPGKKANISGNQKKHPTVEIL